MGFHIFGPSLNHNENDEFDDSYNQLIIRFLNRVLIPSVSSTSVEQY